MTVAIGIVCTDGLVFASDSMDTYGSRASLAKKVYGLSALPAVWTAAGAVFTIEEVEMALAALEIAIGSDDRGRELWLSPDHQTVRRTLEQYVRPTIRSCYEATLREGFQPAADFLFGGWSNGSGWLLEINADGHLTWHQDARFHALGTGGDFASVAQGLMGHYFEGNDLDVESGLNVAYRTIETTCTTSSQWVGLPVQLATVTAEGTTIFESDAVNDVAAKVERWKQLERDTLLKVREGAEKPGAAPA